MKKRVFLGMLCWMQVVAGLAQDTTLFTELPSVQTGITFANTLTESPATNIITYEYFYNGGGMAAGDFNNDGLIDLYFTANMQPNQLYLNKGAWRFENVTKKAGVAGYPGWKTGVSVADVNGDGWLDIYVCYSGNVERKNRQNQLFINNGDGTFTDKAVALGVADAGYSTQAAFFDYDRDGDLDLFVSNHNIKTLRNFDAAYVKKMIDADAGDHLYRNDGAHFTDVTNEAGIIANPLGYGLSVTISDINNDGWPDVYVSNDYVEEDYLYFNNKNGTFTESLKDEMGHLSNFSMGVDIADINNDALPDIFTLDMLPADNKRQKLLYAPDNYEVYNNTVQNGFYHQLMRNMLQLNNGNGTFSEVGQLSGVCATDWSWAALLADYNNDGKKDLFVTNGYGRDMINRDFVKFYANERLKFQRGETNDRMFAMLQGIKITPLHNYIFENTNGVQFKDCSTAWGFKKDDISNGAVYADIDNDGDLDLIVNRLNGEAGLYRNNLAESSKGGHFLNISVEQKGLNSNALGAKVQVYTPAGTIMQEAYPVHGFQSSMQIPLHFGLPAARIDSVAVRWPDGTLQTEKNITVNSTITLTYKNTGKLFQSPIPPKPVFSKAGMVFPFRHVPEDVNDFKVQPLLPNMLSYNGPHIAKGDVNGDGLDDVFICGGKGQAGQLLLQQKGSGFIPADQKAFAGDAGSEDADAIFFDADKDGDLDLYVVSGGYAFEPGDTLLQDRLYINEQGTFVKRKEALPAETFSGSCVRAADADGDGDLDLFVGGRVVPGRYPEAPPSVLLLNDGAGRFSTATSANAVLQHLGMVTDAQWIDLNGDKKPELVVCGEWMSLHCFRFSDGIITDVTKSYFEDSLNGWWNRLAMADLDGDGDLDLVAGNWGTNSQLQASTAQPLQLYYGDFDGNGYVDPLITCYIQNVSYPMATRDEMTDQMTSLRQKFPTYDSYSEAKIEDVLTTAQLDSAAVLNAYQLSTVWFENKNGAFIKHELPWQANMSPVYAISVQDFNGDGHADLLLAGNIEKARLKIGKMDANYGVLLTGDGKGHFTYVPQLQSGLAQKGCVRDLVPLQTNTGQLLLMAINNDKPQLYTY